MSIPRQSTADIWMDIASSPDKQMSQRRNAPSELTFVSSHAPCWLFPFLRFHPSTDEEWFPLTCSPCYLNPSSPMSTGHLDGHQIFFGPDAKNAAAGMLQLINLVSHHALLRLSSNLSDSPSTDEECSRAMLNLLIMLSSRLVTPTFGWSIKYSFWL
ncbi:hypothetical protein AVEN_236160-1 [Araneus ventricosus]|uniref:Uncharacterized protein n=1 Tax=Araneus ventricosus TaxID=182803 RepID=A0A4Y2KA04_ARAVE|nr:hypothetical protein AVEN_236160-1 [Araneus ventricosus]